MTPKPWSFSSISTYRNCPKQYYETKVAKSVTESMNEMGLWGDYGHRKFDAALSRVLAGEPLTLPDNLREYIPYLQRVLATPGRMLVENKYAITKALEPCGWMAGDVWCRGIIDVLHLNGAHAIAIDHKFGKQRDQSDQLKLFAILVFAHHPEIECVTTRYAWLQTGKIVTKVYHREDQSWMWVSFLPDLHRYKESFATLTFDPKPSGLCNGWCPVKSCDFWKPKRN